MNAVDCWYFSRKKKRRVGRKESYETPEVDEIQNVDYKLKVRDKIPPRLSYFHETCRFLNRVARQISVQAASLDFCKTHDA